MTKTDIQTPSSGHSGRVESMASVAALILILAGLGWGFMATMLVQMLATTDMEALGPGMGLFNRFGFFAGLSPETRAALSVLCLPAAASGTLTGWRVDHWLAAYAMWLAMALAMMVPTAYPMLRSFFQASGAKVGATVLVLGGYLSVWGLYAALATLAQWLFNARLAVLSDVAAPMSLAFSASVLVAAGIYQFTPLKFACLARCWSPRFDFSRHGPSFAAAVRTGVEQGWACLGCCAALMSVMFVVGVMNVIWMVPLTALMALEKAHPSRFLPKLIGVALLIAGTALIFLVFTAAEA
ncbi:DUF2182 domain-containing protein [Roseibium sp.]|uniref:DUF2182 domain-containing protein n=1 Tax=Roseibium sp. TaxID=1936156 RepID=UPI003A97F3E1